MVQVIDHSFVKALQSFIDMLIADVIPAGQQGINHEAARSGIRPKYG